MEGEKRWGFLCTGIQECLCCLRLDCCAGLECNPSLRKCMAAQCKVERAACATDSDCCAGLECDVYSRKCAAVQCRPERATCAAGADCCVGLECYSGRCQVACKQERDVCSATSDCCTGLTCDNLSKRCTAIPLCKQEREICFASSDCCAGLACNPSLRKCMAVQCKAERAACATDSDCCNGLLCNPSHQCAAAPVCKQARDTCFASSECCAGLECDIYSKRCQVACKQEQVSCSTDSECCSGLACHSLSKTCRPRAAPIEIIPLLPQSQTKYKDSLPLPRVKKVSCGGSVSLEMRAGSQAHGLQHPTTRERLLSTVWGYAARGEEPSTPSPTLLVDKAAGPDCPITARIVNRLGTEHFLPIDRSLRCGTVSNRGVKCRSPRGSDIWTVVHVHGSKSLPEYDGHPMAWYTDKIDGSIDTGKEFAGEEYYWDNDQAASTLFYHDHAMGLTRLNVYMGLLGFYQIEDDVKRAKHLPEGIYDVPLAFKDMKFEYRGGRAEPFYPTREMDDFGRPLPEHGIKEEFFGDMMMVNGMVWPKLEVEPRQYHLRLLNGCDSRYLRLSIVQEDMYAASFTRPNWQRFAAPMTVVGGDQGLLNEPLTLWDLLLGPAERYEVVVDFAPFAGRSLIVRNTEETPGGPVDPEVDGQWMKVVVQSGRQTALPVQYSWNDNDAISAAISRYGVQREREVLLLEMNEKPLRFQGSGTRKLLLLGTPDFVEGLPFDAPSTENPLLNSVEMWNIINLTPDKHPMHLHNVRFKILNRQTLTTTSVTNYQQTKRLEYSGAPRAPQNYENGPKDMAVSLPGEVVRIAVFFDTPGEFVWHCHILSHEDHEMMRPFTVVEQEVDETDVRNRVQQWLDADPNPYNVVDEPPPVIP